ncbi:hypothetical protein ACFV3E_25185 [Streptomyces sp. NPDC059718]
MDNLDASGRAYLDRVPLLMSTAGDAERLGGTTGSGDGVPTVHVSGDNASLDRVRAVAGRFGRVDGRLTLTVAEAAEAARTRPETGPARRSRPGLRTKASGRGRPGRDAQRR